MDEEDTHSASKKYEPTSAFQEALLTYRTIVFGGKKNKINKKHTSASCWDYCLRFVFKVEGEKSQICFVLQQK